MLNLVRLGMYVETKDNVWEIDIRYKSTTTTTTTTTIIVITMQ